MTVAGHAHQHHDLVAAAAAARLGAVTGATGWRTRGSRVVSAPAHRLLAECAQQPGRALAQPSRQVDRHRAQPVEHRSRRQAVAGAAGLPVRFDREWHGFDLDTGGIVGAAGLSVRFDEPCGLDDQIGLVVPAAPQSAAHLLADVHHAAGPARCRTQPRQLPCRQVAQFAVRAPQRLRGLVMTGHRCELARTVAQRRADGRCGHQAAQRQHSGRLQRRPGQPLGQSVQRDRLQRGHAHTRTMGTAVQACRQRPPQRQPRVVGGHHHRHRRQRIVRLRRRHEPGQRPPRGLAEADRHHTQPGGLCCCPGR